MKNLLTVIIVTTLMSGCNSEQHAQTKTQGVEIAPYVEAPVVEVVPELPIEPTAPTALQPSAPIITNPTPQQPTLPIFIGEGVTTHAQQPYSGTLTKGGDAYLRYNQEAQYFNDFELPEWSVAYRYEPFLEVLITNGSETLCARYSWKKGGFGYARPFCLWSDTRAAVPLEDMQNAYYGYSVVESRVWVNGVVGLGVEISL